MNDFIFGISILENPYAGVFLNFLNFFENPVRNFRSAFFTCANLTLFLESVSSKTPLRGVSQSFVVVHDYFESRKKNIRKNGRQKNSPLEKNGNQIRKIRTNPEFDKTQKLPSGLRSFRSLPRNNKPNIFSGDLFSRGPFF